MSTTPDNSTTAVASMNVADTIGWLDGLAKSGGEHAEKARHAIALLHGAHAFQQTMLSNLNALAAAVLVTAIADAAENPDSGITEDVATHMRDDLRSLIASLGFADIHSPALHAPDTGLPSLAMAACSFAATLVSAPQRRQADQFGAAAVKH